MKKSVMVEIVSAEFSVGNATTCQECVRAHQECTVHGVTYARDHVSRSGSGPSYLRTPSMIARLQVLWFLPVSLGVSG